MAQNPHPLAGDPGLPKTGEPPQLLTADGRGRLGCSPRTLPQSPKPQQQAQYAGSHCSPHATAKVQLPGGLPWSCLHLPWFTREWGRGGGYQARSTPSTGEQPTQLSLDAGPGHSAKRRPCQHGAHRWDTGHCTRLGNTVPTPVPVPTMTGQGLGWGAPAASITKPRRPPVHDCFTATENTFSKALVQILNFTMAQFTEIPEGLGCTGRWDLPSACTKHQSEIKYNLESIWIKKTGTHPTGRHVMFGTNCGPMSP